MDEIGSLWSHQESVEELKQRLLYTTLELESARYEVSEETRKSKENIKQLIELVKITCQERDEARNQLQKLLNNKYLLISSSPSPSPTTTNNFFLVKPADVIADVIPKPNSSMGESNTLSDPYNYHNSSHTSSPVVDSFFHNPPVDVIDQDSLVLESLVEGKSLPEQGKLLQAVLEAGPLLQTLMVAGPLPRWRNPPPVQALHIPPVSINKPVINFGTHVGKSRPFVEMSCGLNFASGRSGSYVGNEMLVPAGLSMSSYVPNGKRQRFQ